MPSRFAASPNTNWSYMALSSASRISVMASSSKAMTTSARAPPLADSRSSGRKDCPSRSIGTTRAGAVPGVLESARKPLSPGVVDVYHANVVETPLAGDPRENRPLGHVGQDCSEEEVAVFRVGQLWGCCGERDRGYARRPDDGLRDWERVRAGVWADDSVDAFDLHKQTRQPLPRPLGPRWCRQSATSTGRPNTPPAWLICSMASSKARCLSV